MEPIKIQIDINLSEGARGVIHDLTSAIGAAITLALTPEKRATIMENLKDAILNGDVAEAEAEQNTTRARITTEEYEAVQKSFEKRPQKDEPAPEAAPAPAKAEPVTNATLFAAVRAAQKERGVAPDTIKAVYASFGEAHNCKITSSRDCPEDLRAELLKAIEAL